MKRTPSRDQRQLALGLLDFATRHTPTRGERLAPEGRTRRLKVLGWLAVLWAVGVALRLATLQCGDVNGWQQWALRQHFSEMQVATARGAIYDRQGRPLALSIPASSVYVRPRHVQEVAATAASLAQALGMPVEEVTKKLTLKAPFVWLKRQISRDDARLVAELQLKGVGELEEPRRVYPFSEAASALIGKVGVDGNGLSGLELTFEERLHAREIKTPFARDALGTPIQISATISNDSSDHQSDGLNLTIDAALQGIVDEELELGRDGSNAKSGMAVMVNADTGEILALSQAPLTNFNRDENGTRAPLRNLVVEKVFEPGSVLKPIVAAAALEEGVVTPEEIIDCENGNYFFASHHIKDAHPVGSVPFFDVLVRSSNIGMAKVGQRLGSVKLHSYLTRFGLGVTSGLRLPGESAGILRPPSAWATIDIATHSFGQGVAVTPLQIVRSMSALANGGILPTLSVVREGGPKIGTRVISERVANEVKEMLFGVVEEKHGTGGKAAVSGVRVGGKTGTAQIAREDGRGYKQGAYMTSFAGVAEADTIGLPLRLTLLVSIEEPNTASNYGGTVAAPIFQRIMHRVLAHLLAQNQLKPPAPAQRELVPERSQSLLVPAHTVNPVGASPGGATL